MNWINDKEITNENYLNMLKYQKDCLQNNPKSSNLLVLSMKSYCLSIPTPFSPRLPLYDKLTLAAEKLISMGASDMTSYGYCYSNRYPMLMSNRLKFIVPNLKSA